MQLQILLLGTCQEISLHYVIYFYIKVVLYCVLLMDLGNNTQYRVIQGGMARPLLYIGHYYFQHVQCRSGPVWYSL